MLPDVVVIKRKDREPGIGGDMVTTVSPSRGGGGESGETGDVGNDICENGTTSVRGVGEVDCELCNEEHVVDEAGR